MGKKLFQAEITLQNGKLIKNSLKTCYFVQKLIISSGYFRKVKKTRYKLIFFSDGNLLLVIFKNSLFSLTKKLVISYQNSLFLFLAISQSIKLIFL